MAPPNAEASAPLAQPARARSTANTWAILSYIAVCVFWGTSGPAIRFTGFYIAPLWLVFLRFFTAGGLLWMGLALSRRQPTIGSLLRVLPSSLALTVSNVLVTVGFHRVESGSGTLTLATTAVTFAVVDTLWPGGRSKPSPLVWAGLLLGLSGVAVLVLGSGTSPNSHWSGYVLLAMSAWTWALGSVAQARHPSGLDPLQSSAWQMLTAAFIVLPLALIFERPIPTHIAPEAIASLAFLIVTASLIAFVCFVYMLQHIPAYLIGSYTYVNAVVAAITGGVWLNERLDSRFFFAATLVVASVALIQWREHKKRAAA